MRLLRRQKHPHRRLLSPPKELDLRRLLPVESLDV